jgi:tetratricopeptide (TPR) repeat protein
LNQSRNSGGGSIREGEELFHQAQLLRLEKSEGVLEKLQIARRIIPDHAALQLIYASQCNAMGSHAEALEACRSVQGIMVRWPAVQLEQALALHKTGKDAEALRVLDQVHRRGFASKDSLALMRDAAYGSRQTQRGESTQTLLERQYPSDPEVRFYSGYSALRQGAYDKATAVFQELSDRFPEQVRYKLAEVQVMLARGDSRAAMDALRKLDAKPELLAPLIGIAHARLQEWEQAAASLAAAVKSPQPAGVHVEYGMVLLQMNRADDAGHQFDLAFARDPKQIDARLGLALAAYSQGNFEGARRQGALLVNNPDLDASRLLFLAAAELRSGQFTNALDFCRLALAKDPKSADARTIRGTALGLMDRFADAERDLAWAAAAKPTDFAVRRELARVHLRAGQFAKALAIIDPVLASSPGDQNAQAIKFETLARSKQWDAAQRYLSSVEGAWPASQFALNRSLLAELRGDGAWAASLIEPHLTNRIAALQWARLKFESGDAPAAVAHLRASGLSAAQWGGLAVLAESRGLTNVTPACYQEALKEDPGNPILLNNWAWSAVQLPGFNTEKVVSACREAYAALPRNPAVMDTYADALLRAGTIRRLRQPAGRQSSPGPADAAVALAPRRCPPGSRPAGKSACRLQPLPGSAEEKRARLAGEARRSGGKN